MRYIKKKNIRHVECLHDENNVPPRTREEATRRWQRFSEKDRLLEILRDEQYGLCAYSEIMPERLGLGFHIEHIRPKSKFPKETFLYKNLVASALTSHDLARPQHGSDCFGGHAKGSWYQRRSFISPVTAKARKNYFLYQSNGKVIASPHKSRRYQKKAETTIRVLNLNSAYLVNLRKRWIDEIDELIDQHLSSDMCLYSLASVDLVPVSGKLSRFFTATRQRFGRIAEKVLADEACDLL